MPKEFVRKRGGKRSGKKGDDADAANASGVKPDAPVDSEAGPSFFIDTTGDVGGSSQPATATSGLEAGSGVGPNASGPGNGGPGEIDPAAPFGYVDPDIKAYLRSVDDRLREWEGLTMGGGEEGESELEDRTTFLHSSLSEIRSLELLLSTDPDCALIMERLLHSMGDWGRRVVADAFSGNWVTLLNHRFGSHVVQTLWALAGGAIDREARGIYPKQHHEQSEAVQVDASIGTLRTMTELISAMTEEITPALPTLLISTFASPPIRLLLFLLSPGRPIPSTAADGAEGDQRIRSKKSQKYRSREAGKMKSILDGKDDVEGDVGAAGGKERIVPDVLAQARRRICAWLRKRLDGNEWRSMGVSGSGGPAVQILLELEAEDGECEGAGSILDHLTSGMVTEDESIESAAKDFIPSLLRDAHGSHLLQAMLKYAPQKQFERMWKLYFVGKIGKLGGHPTGNFVVSTGIERLDEAGSKVAVAEMHAAGASTFIRTSRTAALKALVERAASQQLVEMEVVDLVCESLELGDERALLVQCALTLNIAKSYHNAVKAARGEEVPDEEADDQEEEHGWKPRRPKKVRGSLEPSIQGAVLLQSMLLLHEPAVNVVLDSLLAMKTDELLALAHHPVSSHVLDAVLTSPSVPAKYRRKLILGFIGHYFALADDCFGSRVADTIWARSDGYLKEKIARSMLPKAIPLGNSKYGRFFAKKLNLYLLERRPDEWREMQLGVVHHFNGPKLATTHMQANAAARAVAAPIASTSTPAVASVPAVKEESEGKKRKRVKAEDEAGIADPETAAIDDVFAGVVGEKPKKKKKKTKAME